jgi:hypothetical protein
MSDRILLQDLESHEYLGANGEWVEGCDVAQVFEHTWMALQEGLNHKGRATQVVWCFGNPALSMYMLVRPMKKGRPVSAKILGACRDSDLEMLTQGLSPCQKVMLAEKLESWAADLRKVVLEMAKCHAALKKYLKVGLDCNAAFKQ